MGGQAVGWDHVEAGAREEHDARLGRLLAQALDRLGDAEDYVQHFEITYPTGLDSEGAILVDYAVRGIPEKFFIDANGLMHSKYIGPSDVNSLRDSLNQMLTGRN